MPIKKEVNLGAHKDVFDKLGNKLGYKCMEDWYKVTVDDIHKNGGVTLLNQYDGFAGLGEAADKDDRLYVQICHLIFTRQAVKLESGMKERFGPNFRQRYKDAPPRLQRFEQPKDLSSSGR